MGIKNRSDEKNQVRPGGIERRGNNAVIQTTKTKLEKTTKDLKYTRKIDNRIIHNTKRDAVIQTTKQNSKKQLKT